MNWRQGGQGWWESDSGYRIAASVSPCGAGWRYSAFAPPVGSEMFDERLKVHYRLNERVPQQRPLLGVANDAEAAREICRAHGETENQSP